MPRGDGHALVIPKAPARGIFDIRPRDLARFGRSVQRSLRRHERHEGGRDFGEQFNESAGGQIVFHLHFHILPRWTGVQLRPPGGPIAPAEQLEPAAAKIRAALG